MTTDDEARGVWPWRPVLLAGIGLVAALTIQRLTGSADTYNGAGVLPMPEWRIALTTAIGTAALAFSVGAERVRIGWTVAFALAAGASAGLIHWWSGGGGSYWFGDWRFAAFYLSAGVATPLFQSARDAGGWRFDYGRAHAHAWTDVVLGVAALAFTGIAFALAWLLAALFDLIGLTFLRRLLEHDWCWAGLIGLAYGGGLGLLRERDRVLALLQRVVTAVLAVLAPVLAVGLVVFLLALPFTGLHALWSATRAATPTLLGCAIGALILANAVIGEGPEDEARNRALRGAAVALAACVLPLCMLAAIATGLRLHQYGLTPDRLWALVFVVLATAYGVVYLAGLARGQRWPGALRAGNLRMAFAIVGVGLFLAMPIVSFDALATTSQLARLRLGKVTPAQFDWAGLAFDFGEPGRRALARLTHDPDPRIAALAKTAGSATYRYQAQDQSREQDATASLPKRLRVLPRATSVPPGLLTLLTDYSACGDDAAGGCTLLYTAGASEAWVMSDDCFRPERKTGAGPGLQVVETPHCAAEHLRLAVGDWVHDAPQPPGLTPAQQAIAGKPYAAGRLTIRSVRRRQLFVGDVPLGEAFD